MRVGIERMLNEAANSCSSSVFTFPKTMSVCFSEVASNTGAKPLHGPHQGAQKSTRTKSLFFTTCSKLSLVNAIVAMLESPGFVEAPIIITGVFASPSVAPSENPQSSASIRAHPVISRNKAQQRRFDLRHASERIEAVPEHERDRQERIVVLCHFGDAVVRRHEYDAPQGAMRRQVNRNTAAQTAAHRDDTSGPHLRTPLCIVMDQQRVFKELLLPGLAFALPVAAIVHEQQRPAGKLVRKVDKPGNLLRVAAEVDDERRGRPVALYQPAAELDAVGGSDAHLLDVRTRREAGVERTREEQHPLLEKPQEQRRADGDPEHDLHDRTDHQCSLTLGSVPRLRNRASVSSATPTGPWSAYRCILYSDRYISRANQPSTR